MKNNPTIADTQINFFHSIEVTDPGAYQAISSKVLNFMNQTE